MEEVQLRGAVACHCHGNGDVASRVMQSESPTLCELLLCLELKAMLRRISTFISSTAWLKK